MSLRLLVKLGFRFFEIKNGVGRCTVWLNRKFRSSLFFKKTLEKLLFKWQNDKKTIILYIFTTCFASLIDIFSERYKISDLNSLYGF